MIELRWKALKESKPHEYVVRFIFGGLCTVLAGVIAHRWGPEAGGLFLAFPAIFPAGASLVESHERKRKREIGADGTRRGRLAAGIDATGADGTRRGRLAAGIDATGAAFGCIGLALFAVVVWRLLPAHGSAGVILAASLLWGAAAFLLWELRKRRFLRRHA